MAGVIMVITCQSYCAQLKSAEIQKKKNIIIIIIWKWQKYN